MSEMAEAIRQLIEERGYSEESVRQTIERALKAAYKRTYGTDENAIVKFNEDMSDVSIPGLVSSIVVSSVPRSSSNLGSKTL